MKIPRKGLAYFKAHVWKKKHELPLLSSRLEWVRISPPFTQSFLIKQPKYEYHEVQIEEMIPDNIIGRYFICRCKNCNVHATFKTFKEGIHEIFR